MMRLPSLRSIAFAALALALMAADAQAQNYPNRPITLVVPLAPSGGMDFIGRTFAQKLSERLGQPVLVENRVGGGTVVATVQVAKAAPDGYTLLLVPGPTLTTNLTIYKTLPYDPRNDFVPIALTSQVAFSLVVNPSLPVKSVSELLNYAKAKPGKLNVGTAGIATMTHLAGEILKIKTGIDIKHVHYRGTPPAMNDVIAGHVQMVFADPVSAAPLARDGKVRALGATSLKRIGVFPELPPIAEAGVPGYEATNWHMVVAPANTPADVVQKLAAEFRAIGAMPEVKQQIEKIGLLPMDNPPAEAMRAYLDAEITAWSKFVQQIGLAGSL
jgi:tripartite-type tricarboxylate transporter receptor subunit TctC